MVLSHNLVNPLFSKVFSFELEESPTEIRLALTQTLFTHFYAQKNLNYNLVIVASAEEESSGAAGLNSMLSIIPKIDVAIVGEPTLMQLAVAEKGLVVFDALVKGTPGHAAHPNDDNAIYNVIEVLQWFKEYQFEKDSVSLGPVKMTVTQINAGKQHNAIPAEVELVVDVRVNDQYSNKEIVAILQKDAPCDSIIPRSLHTKKLLWFQILLKEESKYLDANVHHKIQVHV